MYSRESIARMTANGMSAAQIAVELGCSSRTVTRVRAELGIGRGVPANSSEPVSLARLEAIRLMVEDSSSLRDIARTIGCTRGTILRHFPGSGWSYTQAGEIAAALRKFRAMGGRSIVSSGPYELGTVSRMRKKSD